jgi:hypothetical protein
MFTELLIEQRQNIGKRIRLISMKDPFPVESGTLGTIVDVDGIGQYRVQWDNGRTLSVIPDEDEFEIFGDGEGV